MRTRTKEVKLSTPWCPACPPTPGDSGPGQVRAASSPFAKPALHNYLIPTESSVVKCGLDETREMPRTCHFANPGLVWSGLGQSDRGPKARTVAFLTSARAEGRTGGYDTSFADLTFRLPAGIGILAEPEPEPEPKRCLPSLFSAWEIPFRSRSSLSFSQIHKSEKLQTPRTNSHRNSKGAECKEKTIQIKDSCRDWKIERLFLHSFRSHFS